MVPRAGPANLDDVRDVCAGPGCQARKFAAQRDAPTVSGQAWAEHVRHVNESPCLADRTGLRHFGADFTSGSHQLGVSVAYVGPVGDASTERSKCRRASQPVVDMTLARIGVARRHSKDDASIVGAPVGLGPTTAQPVRVPGHSSYVLLDTELAEPTRHYEYTQRGHTSPTRKGRNPCRSSIHFSNQRTNGFALEWQRPAVVGRLLGNGECAQSHGLENKKHACAPSLHSDA